MLHEEIREANPAARKFIDKLHLAKDSPIDPSSPHSSSSQKSLFNLTIESLAAAYSSEKTESFLREFLVRSDYRRLTAIRDRCLTFPPLHRLYLPLCRAELLYRLRSLEITSILEVYEFREQANIPRHFYPQWPRNGVAVKVKLGTSLTAWFKLCACRPSTTK